MTAVAIRSDAQLLEDAFLGGLEDAQSAYERIVETEAWLALGFDSFGQWWDMRAVPAMRALSMRPTREIAAAVVERVRGEEALLPPAQRRTQRELAEMIGASEATVGRMAGTRSTPASSVAGGDLEPLPEPASEDAVAVAAIRPDRTPAAVCEACGGPMNEGQYESGFMRCDDCDGDEAHTAHGWPNGREGGCATCGERSEPKPVELPAHQGHADASIAAIDEAAAARAAVANAMDRFLPPDVEGDRLKWRIAFLKAMAPASKLMAQFAVEQVAEQADDECLNELFRLARDLTSYGDRVRAAVKPNNVRHLKAVS